MKKQDLLKLIETIGDEDSVLDVLTQNIDEDGLKSILDGETGKGYLQSYGDTKVTKGIETWKQNNLEKLIDAEVVKRTGKNETPEQKSIRELQEKLATIEKEKTKAEMVSKFKDTLNEKNIPSKLIDFVLGEDEEVTTANIALFEETMKGYVQNQVDDRFKQNNHDPSNTNTTTSLENEIKNAMMGL